MIYAHVDEQSVASVVSDWTGIPVGRMVRDEIETVLKLPEILNRRVVGQSHGLADDRQADRDQPRQARQSLEADRRVHAGRPLRRRQDRDRAGAGRDAVWRRAEHDHHQHVGVPGGAHRLVAEGRAARLCRLWRGRAADRGGAAQALQRRSCSTRSRRRIPTCTRSSSRCSTRASWKTATAAGSTSRTP